MPHAAAASWQIRPRCARLLAKPEYFSPPDEAVAGRDAVAELLAGALQRRAIGKMLLAGAPGARFLIQQRRHVQKAFLQRSNC